MGALWTPPGSAPASRPVPPSSSLRLSDGRLLRLQEPFSGVDPGSGAPYHGYRYSTADGLRVIATMDSTPHGNLLHVSMSYADHDPSWEDIRAVRDVFYPSDVDAMMVLPRESDYVNVMPHCFHLWQTPVVWGIG
jgi:hypothetical protein